MLWLKVRTTLPCLTDTGIFWWYPYFPWPVSTREGDVTGTGLAAFTSPAPRGSQVTHFYMWAIGTPLAGLKPPTSPTKNSVIEVDIRDSEQSLDVPKQIRCFVCFSCATWSASLDNFHLISLLGLQCLSGSITPVLSCPHDPWILIIFSWYCCWNFHGLKLLL